MAIRTKEEIISAISARIGDDSSDEALALLEDVSDTLADMEAAAATDWKTKYEANDREWRERYKSRFMSGEQVVENPEEVPEVTTGERLTFEKLFEEE